MAVNYNQDSGEIAASPYLDMTDDLVPNTDYPVYEAASEAKARFVFEHTIDLRVKCLFGNHYLDIRNLEQKKFWPKDDFATIDAQDAKSIHSNRDRVYSRQQQVIVTLITHAERTALPVRAGEELTIIDSHNDNAYEM